jgi:LppX_LprAFG lipoprotein
MQSRSLALALGAAALLVGAAACGGSEESGTAAEAVEPSSDAASSEASSDEAASETPAADPEAAAFGKALIEAQRRAGSVRLDGVFEPGMTMSGSMRFHNDDVALDMRLKGVAMGGQARMILVDETMYMQIPEAGSDFIKLDVGDPDNPLAQQMGSLNPSRAFETFATITQIRERGTETVGGTPTTRYTITVDTAQAMDAQGLHSGHADGLPPELSYDLWVGDDNLIRKMVLAPELGEVEIRLSAWGEPVRITAPPPSQVQQFPGTTG